MSSMSVFSIDRTLVVTVVTVVVVDKQTTKQTTKQTDETNKRDACARVSFKNAVRVESKTGAMRRC